MTHLNDQGNDACSVRRGICVLLPLRRGLALDAAGAGKGDTGWGDQGVVDQPGRAEADSENRYLKRLVALTNRVSRS
jgi:hypothetical protein